MMKKFLFVFIGIGILTTILHALYLYNILPPSLTFSDVALFTESAVAPGWFYLDKNIEYPILTGMFVQLMGFLSGGSKLLYMIFSSLALVGFGAGTTYLLYQMLPEDKKKNLWIFWVLAPSMFIFMTYNFDMLVLFEVVLAFYLMQKERPVSASVVLALGFCTKLYPIIYLLPFVLKMDSNRIRFKAIGAFLATSVSINIFFVLTNFDGWYYFYLFNTVRAFGLDSMWTVIAPWFQPWLYDVDILNSSTLAVFCLGYFYIIKKYRHVELLWLGFWVTIVYALTTKVFTPQHLLWFLPFFVLLSEPKKFLYYFLESANIFIISFVLYFHFIPSPEALRVILLIEPFTVIRFFILVTILYLSMRRFEPQRSLDTGDNISQNISPFIQKFKHLIAVGLFIVLALVMTWPLVTKITHSYPSTFHSIGGDPNMYISYMDLVVKKFQGELPLELNRMIYYPGGVNLSGGYEAPIMFLIGAPVILLTDNPILAYNLILLLAFVLTALSSYFLVLYLTKSFSISLISGFSFGFSIYMIVRGLQHLDLLLLFTVPWLVLATLKFFEKPDYKNILFLSLAVFITALSAWYYLVGGIIFIAIAGLVNWNIVMRAKKMIAIGSLAVTLGVLLPALPIILNGTPQITENADEIVNLTGAQPLSFILPHPFNVVLGFLTEGIYKQFPSVYNVPYPYFEQTSYYGIIGLIAVVTLVFFRKKFSIPNKALWLCAFLIFMVLAMGNYFQIGRFFIPLPFKALHEIFPFDHMRAPNRFFVFSYLAAVVIFSYFLLEIRKIITTKKFRLILGTLLVLMLFAERLVFPYTTVSLPVSQFYRDLGKDPGNYAIVDLPIARNWGDSSYNYFQIYHKKPIVGGEYFWTAYDDHTYDFIRSNTLLFNAAFCNPDLNNLNQEKSLAELAENNIKYVVVHNFTLHDLKDCPDVGRFVRLFFENKKPVFVDGELSVYSTID